MELDSARLRRELRDLVEVVLVPAICILLPWKLAFLLYKKLAMSRWLYREPSERALSQAQAMGWAPDPASWLHKRKLTALIDHADHYLVRTRGDGWMDSHLQIEGAWPSAEEPAIALTFHWGAGMWGLRSAGRAGLHAHMLVASLDGGHMAGRSVLRRYIEARIRSIALALKYPFIVVTSDMRPAIRALQKNDQLFAVIDVPADQVSASQPVRVLDLPARLPTALLRLAVGRKIPVCIYVTGFRPEDGKRFLRIRQLGVPSDLDSLLEVVANELDGLIRENPPAWHFWSEAQRFFRH